MSETIHLLAAETCGRCGAVVPAFQECCVTCLVSDLKSLADEYFDAAPLGCGILAGADFTLLEEIGRGGMGVVYRAQQNSPMREVAIKLLLPHHASSPDIRRRMFAEAAAMAELNHPGILPLYASGESEGQPWLAMKLACGGTLSARRGEWIGQWRPIAELLAGLSDALQHAHERGIIHRDVKPGNILFDETGRACLADFGLVKWLNSKSSETLSHAMLGTPAYLAPEVAHTGARAATTASDVYGLGAVLYELLTGAPPFKGAATAELLQRIANEEPPAPRRLRQDVPADLEIICQKAMAKEPSSRYPGAAGFGKDLRRWLSGEVITARRLSRGQKIIRLVRRNPLPFSLAAALVLALLSGSVAVWIKNHNLVTTLDELKSANQKVATSRAAAEDRVAFMVQELPPMLEPLGKLPIIKPVFEDVEQYYLKFGESSDPDSLARQAQFNIAYALVLRPLGDGDGARRKLNAAVRLGETATSFRDARAESWVALVSAQRSKGEHAARERDFIEAEQSIMAAVDNAQLGLKRFPGDMALRAESADATTDLAYALLERGNPGDARLAGSMLDKALAQCRELIADPRAISGSLLLRIRRQETYCLYEKGRAAMASNEPRTALGYFQQHLAACQKLADEFKHSGEEKRRLCSASNRVADALFRANDAEGKPVPIDEVNRLLDQSENILGALVQNTDPANQVWRSEWGLTALALGYLEQRRNNPELSRKWFITALDRLAPVTPAALPAVDYSRSVIHGALAENIEAWGDVMEASKHWNIALEAGFQYLHSNPFGKETHQKWEERLSRTIGHWSKHLPRPLIADNLETWIGRIEKEVGVQGSVSWWLWTGGRVYRRLAEVHRELENPTGAAKANRRALELRSQLLQVERMTESEEISAVTRTAEHLLGAASPVDDRKTIAKCLTAGARQAGLIERRGEWRTKWAELISLAMESVDPAESAPLAREARQALFPEAEALEWTAPEQKARAKLREFETLPDTISPPPRTR